MLQTVEYDGDAPGFVGLQQINIALNPATPVGDGLLIMVGSGFGSQSTVHTTISITN